MYWKVFFQAHPWVLSGEYAFQTFFLTSNRITQSCWCCILDANLSNIQWLKIKIKRGLWLLQLPVLTCTNIKPMQWYMNVLVKNCWKAEKKLFMVTETKHTRNGFTFVKTFIMVTLTNNIWNNMQKTSLPL
jgi:hypothetical protein